MGGIDIRIWGKLELQKSFFYAMYWNFNPEGDAHLMTIPQQKLVSDVEIKVTDPDTQLQVPVLQKECTIAHRRNSK